MDFKLMSATFLTVFFAEMGDKTQLAALSLSARGKSIVEIFIGSVLALVLATVIGIAVGRLGAEFLSPRALQLGSGSLFILMGVLILWGKI